MSVYHQMGHDSENLVGQVGDYTGAILSPVNATFEKMSNLVSEESSHGLEFIFDPQLYSPRSEHENLRAWSYFPDDVDTADLGDPGWWRRISQDVLRVSGDLGVHAVCSPTVVPNNFDLSFYDITVEAANVMVEEARGVEVLQSAVVRLGDLASSDWVMKLASMLSRTGCSRVYLIILTDTTPRREISESEPLGGALRLVAELQEGGVPALVAFCGPEAILYTEAGAQACATGKFFNLRRFTPGRFEEPAASGGGQLPYWFEENLLAYLREADLKRVRERLGADALSASSTANPHGQAILERLESEPGRAWVALSWRHYMHWFSDVDRRLRSGEVCAEELLSVAEGNWDRVQESGLLMEEPRNDGRWVRPWRIALREHRGDDS